MPLPRSSQTRNRRIIEASASLRDLGGESTKRWVSTRGSPGLVISIRSSKISTIGPEPVTKKSWWMRALATSSRTASSGNIGTVFRKRSVNLDYLTAVLEEALADHPLLRGAQLLRLEDRLIIALPSDLLFPEGRANLSDRAEDALFNLGGVLRNIGNQIGVNGHSDPSPPMEEEYDSNWELSLARAIAVANSFKRSGYTEDIIAYGYSDSRYSQLPDLPEEERRQLGRRVDIMVMPTAGEL